MTLLNLWVFINTGRFSIKNVVPSPEGDSSKVKVRVRMDGHGIFSVCSAQLVEKIPSEPEQETAEPMDTAQEGQKKEEQQQQQQQQVDGETPAATVSYVVPVSTARPLIIDHSCYHARWSLIGRGAFFAK